METNRGLPLIAPQVVPILDPGFRPAVLADRGYRALVDALPDAVPVRLALEQADGTVFRFDVRVFPDAHPESAANFTFAERLIKFLLWSRGGWRIYLDGPASLAARLTAHYRETATGKFDAHLVAERMFDHPLEIVHTSALPQERAKTRPLGRHLDGCRIGFDLGGSDRKVAALIDGTVVFSEETVWDPYYKPDPQYHFDGIMDSLSKAAAHLPRVDAIGGSSAGVIVNNRVQVALSSLPEDVRRQGVTVKKKSSALLGVIAVYSPKHTHDPLFISNYVTINLLDQIKSTPGVGDATLWGPQDYSMRAWVRTDRLTGLGLTTGDIINAIKAQNVQAAVGRIGARPISDDQQLQLNIQTQGRLNSVADFENIVVRTNPDGSVLRLRDVARVELGAANLDRETRLNGGPAAAVAIYQTPGANAIATLKQVRDRITEAEKRFPEDLA